jgi:hypothetical protein
LRLLALVGALALLAGCRLDLNVAIDLAPDGTGTVRVTATADADLLARVPNAVTDLRLDDAKAAGWTVTGPTPAESGGAQVVLTKPFGSPEQATAILAEINGPSGPLRGLRLTQSREFATVTSGLTGEVRLDGGVGAFADQALVQVAGGKVPLADRVAASGVPLDQALGLTVAVDLPGRVTSTNGTIAGGEVTWSPALAEGQSTPLQASARKVDTVATRARSVEHWTSWALLGWGVLFGLILLLLVSRALWRRRRSALP